MKCRELLLSALIGKRHPNDIWVRFMRDLIVIPLNAISPNAQWQTRWTNAGNGWLLAGRVIHPIADDAEGWHWIGKVGVRGSIL